VFYYGDGLRKSRGAICNCNDDPRPVVFKPEAADKESEIPPFTEGRISASVVKKRSLKASFLFRPPFFADTM
jgi:hypothetical protein